MKISVLFVSEPEMKGIAWRNVSIKAVKRSLVMSEGSLNGFL
jgi:hypothetical protein